MDGKMVEKYNLSKDSLKAIVTMMEWIEENHQQLTEEDLIKKFGKAYYHLFQRYCMGGTSDMEYARPSDNKFFLTQLGVRKLHYLRRIVAEEKRAEEQKNTNLIIAITGAALVSLTGIVSALDLYGDPGGFVGNIIAFIIGGIIGLASSLMISSLRKLKSN